MGETDLTALHTQLCAAITRRTLVLFEYGDLIRVVEPHRFGVNSAGHAVLSGWLRAGYSRSDPAGGWRNYLVSDIRSLQLLDAPFAGTRPGFAAHDPRMREVYAELTPTSLELPIEGPYVVREPMSPPARAAQRADAPPAPPVPPTETANRSSAIEPPEATR
jgi:hypothetical protein